MNDSEPGKTVLGEDWPLQEMLLRKEELIASYIECGNLSGQKIGIPLGQDEDFYYIAWYLLDLAKLVLHKSSKSLFDNGFPSEEDKLEMQKKLPKYPLQPIGLRNRYLEQIITERNIRRL